MKRLFLCSCVLSCLTILCHSLQAEVRLPAIISDHMVLQQGAPVPIWGWAEAGEEVQVSLNGKSQSAKANADGKWLVRLENLEAGGPHTLTVKGSNTVTVDDVLVGEVWLGSGQSNMAMTVSRAKDFETEKAAANLPQIRMFTVTSGPADTAQEDCTGTWIVCSPETIGNFSATLFFCGRELHRSLKVPVGLINSSVGGTPIEAWIDPHLQRSTPELAELYELQAKNDARFNAEAARKKYERDLAEWKKAAAKAKAEKKKAPRAPRDPIATRERRGNVGGLFNGKIAPLIPYAIRGALWYQGEANSTDLKAPYYEHQLTLLVTDWRKRWGYEFPMAWVQLPNFASRGEGWVLVREAMLNCLKLPNTGMAITVDIGDPGDIHPQNKQDVGKRLAMWALATVYNKQGVASSGPLPAGHEVRGKEIVVRFKHADCGLVAKDGELKEFEIAGEDGQWKPAKARIEKDTVVVTSAEVARPVAARYSWKDNPEATLYNGAGLPASPFRTRDK